jgi:hypothetical protein
VIVACLENLRQKASEMKKMRRKSAFKSRFTAHFYGAFTAQNRRNFAYFISIQHKMADPMVF